MNLSIMRAGVLILASMLLAACGEKDCRDCNADAGEPLIPEQDMAGYLNIGRQVLYAMPKQEHLALQALHARSVGDGHYQITLVALSGQTRDITFTVKTTGYPYLYAELGDTVLADFDKLFEAVRDIVNNAANAARQTADSANDNVEAAANAATDAIDQAQAAAAAAIAESAVAAGDAAAAEEAPSWRLDNIFYSNERGIAIWKNARCGTPTPRTVSACQGPIGEDGEDLEGMYWRTTAYSKAKCVRGSGICTELRQAGGFIEIAEDNQCSIVREIRLIDTRFYCQ